MFANLSRDEIAVLALIAGLADERGIFNRGRDAKKLTKLAFLASYAEEVDSNGIRLRGNPRLGLRFHVYLYGVASKDIYGILDRLVEKGFLEHVDINIYSVKVSLNEVLGVVRRMDDDLYRGVVFALSYRYMTGDELEGFVNGLLGIGGPEIKALVYGTEVQKLIEAREHVKKLEEKDMIVDI
ncbi:MAG: hypothetical protein QXE01_02460 [Sulfolobales archaeon]